MSRRDAVFESGEYYHLYNRGCNREEIFREGSNYYYLLHLLGDPEVKADLSLVCYCLMPNHFHFLVKQETDCSISTAMQRIFNTYVKGFNRRFGRTGTLFEGQFKAKHIRSEELFAHLCRYIHRNPVEAGLVREPGQWPFSDFLEWTGERPPTVSGGFVPTAYFSSPTDYERFVVKLDSTPHMQRLIRDVSFDESSGRSHAPACEFDMRCVGPLNTPAGTIAGTSEHGPVRP